ncbi:MAG: helix-turn-helix transcriptional regulator [Raoultibacter sp.]
MLCQKKELRISRELWLNRMSQAECARRAGVQPSSMSRIVRGLEPAYPNRGQRIADALGWQGDPAALFEEVPADEFSHA